MRFSIIPDRLRETTEAMSQECQVDIGLWLSHSNLCRDAALKIEALERELALKEDKLREETRELELEMEQLTLRETD